MAHTLQKTPIICSAFRKLTVGHSLALISSKSDGCALPVWWPPPETLRPQQKKLISDTMSQRLVQYGRQKKHTWRLKNNITRINSHFEDTVAEESYVKCRQTHNHITCHTVGGDERGREEGFCKMDRHFKGGPGGHFR